MTTTTANESTTTANESPVSIRSVLEAMQAIKAQSYPVRIFMSAETIQRFWRAADIPDYHPSQRLESVYGVPIEVRNVMPDGSYAIEHSDGQMTFGSI